MSAGTRDPANSGLNEVFLQPEPEQSSQNSHMPASRVAHVTIGPIEEPTLLICSLTCCTAVTHNTPIFLSSIGVCGL